MINLFTTYLKPYWKQLVLVIVLVLAQAMGNLFLPDLNAEIINNGVAKGDIAVHPAARRDHARWSRSWSAPSRSSRCTGAPRPPWRSAETCAARSSGKVEAFSQTEVNFFGTPSLITRNTNDVQQVQQVVVMGLNMMILAPIMAIGGIIMAVRRTSRSRPTLVVILPLMGGVIGTLLVQGAAAVQVDADQDRPHQPGHARDALGRPRDPRVRARPTTRKQRFDVANRDLTDTSLKVDRICSRS